MANKILDKINKKTLTLIIAIIAVILILLVFIIIKIVSKSDTNDKNISSSQNSYSDQSSDNDSSNMDSSVDASLDESDLTSSKQTTSTKVNTSKKATNKTPLTNSNSKAAAGNPPSDSATSTSPTAVEIINKTNQNIQNIQNLKTGLSLKSEIANPATLNISVPETYDLDKAANSIIDQMKKGLSYNETNNKSDPHVFDYDYKITDNGKTGTNKSFKLEYKFKKQQYKTSTIDSDKIVETVINKMNKSGYQHIDYLPNEVNLESIPISENIFKYDIDTSTDIIRDNLIMDIESLEEQTQKRYKQFNFIYYSEYENEQGEKGLMFKLYVK